MQRLIALFLALTFTIPASYADETCEIDVETGLSQCFDVSTEADHIASCEEEVGDSPSNIQNEFEPEENPINFCDEKVVFGGKKPTSSERKQKIKELTKQCKKKAKAYKKEVAKSLLKKFKLGQFVQAKLKRKKKLFKTKVNREKIKLDIGFTPEEVAKMGKEEFSAHMMNKIRQQVPSIDELMKNSSTKNAFKGSFAKQESFPLSMVVGTKGGNNCIVESPEFPKEEPFSPEICELCTDTNIQDNFENDCSYMVSENFSEEKARELMRAGDKKVKKQDQFCNRDVEPKKAHLTELDNTSKRLCNIAQEGLVPDFEIKSSRNLYNDYTPDLAAKRGQFTQAYIFDHLKKNCKMDKEDMPDWLSSEEAFAEKVKVSHPVYLRPNNDEGNYGPDPYATGADREKEKEYLSATLDHELKEIEDKIKNYNDKLKNIKDELAQIETKINGGNGVAGLRKQYNETQKTIKDADLRTIKDQQIFVNKVTNEAHMYYARKKELLQEQNVYKIRVLNLEQDKNSPKFSKSGGNYEMVNKLSLYYTEKDRGDNQAFRTKWDDLLFNQFKMARISGNVSRENEFGIPEDMMTPELQLALNSLVEVESFSCQLNPMSTKKVSLQGILKGGLKVITGGVLLAGGVVGAALTPVAGVINTGISLFCVNCREPGRVPPIMRWGNLFHLNLSRSSRKGAWKATGKFIKNFINWGGVLKVHKSKSIRKHDLEKYAKQRGSKPYGSMSPSEQSDLLNEFLEEVKQAEIKQCYNFDRVDPVDKNTISTDRNDNGTNSKVIKQ